MTCIARDQGLGEDHFLEAPDFDDRGAETPRPTKRTFPTISLLKIFLSEKIDEELKTH